MSVVIPTRDRCVLLADCLSTLTPQVPPPGGWEIIVVDDGTEVDLRSVIEQSIAAGLPVRYVRQEPAGLNAARNRGVSAATGEIVAFLDDDTLVQSGWAVAVDKAFAEQDLAALGGRVRLQLEEGGEFPHWLTEGRMTYLSRYDLGPAPCEVRRSPLPVGANFALTRECIDSLGGFRTGLDRIGGELISNGEWELLRRLLGRGGRVLYWPGAEVVHRVPAERLTKEWFRRRARAQGISDVRTDPLEEGSYPLRMLREVVRAGRALPILFRRLLERRGSFDAELWLVACRARLGELRKQRGLRA